MKRTANPTRPATVDDLIDDATIARLGGLDLSSKKIFSGRLKGERRSKKRGESVEFADHRPYVMGDDLRHIDWNIYARLDRFFMKLFLEEEDLSLHVVLDGSASADCGEPGKFHFMQRAAMAMGYVGLTNLNRVACTVMGGELATPAANPADDEPSPDAGRPGDLFAPEPESQRQLTHDLRDLRGRRRVHDLARFLCSVTPGGESDFPAAAKRISLARRGKGVMIVFSDFLFKEGYEQGLRMLVGRGYDLFCVQVLSPQEIDPDLAGDLRLVDIEDGDRAEITMSAPLLKRYKQNLAAYTNRLRTFCARREITLMTVPSDTAIDTLLVDYFRNRGVLV